MTIDVIKYNTKDTTQKIQFGDCPVTLTGMSHSYSCVAMVIVMLNSRLLLVLKVI